MTLFAGREHEIKALQQVEKAWGISYVIIYFTETRQMKYERINNIDFDKQYEISDFWIVQTKTKDYLWETVLNPMDLLEH